MQEIKDGYRIGYIRVSTVDQNPDLQLQGIHLDERLVEVASGKNVKRPQLEELLKKIRSGDVIIVQSIDRMARNLLDLKNIVDLIAKKKARIEFIRENLFFTGEDSPTSKLLLNIMGSLAEFERCLMKERQKEGIALARERGAYTGRKPSLSPEQAIDLKERVVLGIPKSKIARHFKITRETVYQYLKKPTPIPSI